MKWFIVVCLFIPVALWGQGVDVEHYAPSPLVELSDLWKIQVTGLSNTSEPVWFKAEVKRQSALIYQATTEPIETSIGVVLLDQFQVQIKSQHFHERDWEDYVVTTGRLPAGMYTGCVTVYQGQKELKTLCVEIKSENYSPPMLIYPYADQELTNTNPVLSWLPPVPNALQGISYTLKLVEKRQGQTAQEALLRNPAMVFQEGVPLTSMPYPPDALPLQVGHSYAWQVEAFVGSMRIGVTQVWSFRVVEVSDQLQERIRNQDYVELNAQAGSNPIAAIQKLNVKFVESGSRSKYNILVFNETGEEIKGRISVLKNRSGDNYHSIDLSKLKGIRHKELYAVVFTNPETGERFTLNLQYLDPDKL